METILVLGGILAAGLLGGELAAKLTLPRITGYLAAGLLLNPGSFGAVGDDFVSHTGLATDISLAVITFAIGGKLIWKNLKKLGSTIAAVSVLAAEATFAAVGIGLYLILSTFPGFGIIEGASIAAFALLAGALAAPTDPTASLAVIEEYDAEGEVTDTVMGSAAVDDALGILHFSLALAIGEVLVRQSGFDVSAGVVDPLFAIMGGIFIGGILGYGFTCTTWCIKREKEGVLIIVILALLFVCYGLAGYLSLDELLATMTLGAVVANTNPLKDKLFSLVERYTEELIFLLFFTLSAMHLQLSALSWGLALLLVAYVLLRGVGKVGGSWLGAKTTDGPTAVRNYAGWCLLPQGGIIVGLALIIQEHPAFGGFGSTLMGLVLGATIVHEFLGPILTEKALREANEVQT